jgi:hypothetical protein
MWPFKKKKLSAAEQKQEDYAALGKQVAALYDHLNPDRSGLYRTAFLKGVITGLGTVIGATVVIAILAWVLTVVGSVPFLHDITENVRQTIEQ